MWHPLSRENAMILVSPKTLVHDQADFPIHDDIADPPGGFGRKKGKPKTIRGSPNTNFGCSRKMVSRPRSKKLIPSAKKATCRQGASRQSNQTRGSGGLREKSVSAKKSACIA